MIMIQIMRKAKKRGEKVWSYYWLNTNDVVHNFCNFICSQAYTLSNCNVQERKLQLLPLTLKSMMMMITLTSFLKECFLNIEHDQLRRPTFYLQKISLPRNPNWKFEIRILCLWIHIMVGNEMSEVALPFAKQKGFGLQNSSL